jgi:hypothetical protein
MRLILVFLLLAGTGLLLPAQDDPGRKQVRLDSLKQQLRADSSRIFRYRPAKPYLRVENRYSFISQRPVNLVGFMAGATFLEKHILCAGYYILNRYNKESIEIIHANNVMTREYLSFNYFVFSYQYVLLSTRYLQINAPIELGYGLYSTKTTDPLGVFLGKSTGNLIPISGGFQFIVKPLRWVGFSTVGGYRHTIQERSANLDFTGFYYSFGLWVDARHVFRSTRYYLKKRQYSHQVRKIQFQD